MRENTFVPSAKSLTNFHRGPRGAMLHPREQKRLAGGPGLRVRLSGRAHRAGSNQGRRWRADFFLLRAVRAAWLNSLRKKS
jgi:hypothetical protein